MKIYIVLDDWATSDDCGTQVVGAFTSRQRASECLNETVKEIKENPCYPEYDREEFVEGDYFDAYDDGFYMEGHDHIYIEEIELEEE